MATRGAAIQLALDGVATLGLHTDETARYTQLLTEAKVTVDAQLVVAPPLSASDQLRQRLSNVGEQYQQSTVNMQELVQQQEDPGKQNCCQAFLSFITCGLFGKKNKKEYQEIPQDDSEPPLRPGEKKKPRQKQQ